VSRGISWGAGGGGGFKPLNENRRGESRQSKAPSFGNSRVKTKKRESQSKEQGGEAIFL